MSTLLSRAKALVVDKPAVAGALAIIPLAAAATSAKASFVPAFTFNTGSAFYTSPANSGGGIVDHTATLSASGTNPISLSGNTSITAAQYTANSSSSYSLDWNGSLNTSNFPAGSTLGMNYDFTINLTNGNSTGGTVTWLLTSLIGGASTLSASGTASGASTHLTGSKSEVIHSALSGSTWDTVLQLTWTGEDPASTMSVSVPADSSVDLSVATPEPASLSLLTAAVAGLILKRRRKLA